MMSVGQPQSRIMPSTFQESNPKRNSKPSRLVALQADFQKKILKEKEEKLIKHINTEQQKRDVALRRYTDIDDRYTDSSSAPGGVRNFFRQRNQSLPHSNSAGTSHHRARKKEGYDKSRPLEPLNYNNQNSVLGRDQALNTSKNPASERSNQEFVRWRLEQDAMDRQRRLNAAKERTMQNNLHQYSPREQNGFLQQRNQEEVDHRAAESQRQEAERQKRTLIRQRQEEKRREQAERGRRRREESERRQKELADDLKRQKEAELAEEEEQEEIIRQLEERLKEKQKDLADIKKRKPKERDLNTPDSYIPPSSRSEAISKPIRNQQPSQLSHWSESSSVFPVKAKKVIRKDSKSRQRPREDTGTHTGPSYHNDRGYSPVPTQSKSKTHELNTTFKVSRENSMPINANNSAELPFVTDGAGLDMELSPCANCGRKFAVDRLSKHQKACKKVSKPRKQYNMTSHRIAGSGAEKYQYKVKQETKNPPKAKKKDWRAKHNEFIATIRYAKMASAVEAKGGNIADLAPPPKTDNSDYIQCPHCSRKFNETAAERHIPKCKDIKAKPTMLKKGGRR